MPKRYGHKNYRVEERRKVYLKLVIIYKIYTTLESGAGNKSIVGFPFMGSEGNQNGLSSNTIV